MEDPFHIDKVSKKSSTSALLPFDEIDAHDNQEAQQQRVRAQRSLQRDLDTLQDAVRGAGDEGSSSLRSRFSVQGRNNKGKTRASLASDSAIKKGESPVDFNKNEWLLDEIDLPNNPAASSAIALSTPSRDMVPTLLHSSGAATSSGSGQISSAARRHPSILVSSQTGDSADDDDDENQAKPDAVELPERKTKTPRALSPQPSVQAANTRFASKPWVWLIGAAALLITLWLALWLWPTAENAPEQPTEVVAPNDVAPPPTPTENGVR